MPFAVTSTAVTLVIGLFIGSFAFNVVDAQEDVLSSVSTCLREASLTKANECDKAVAAKMKALQATAAVFMPRGGCAGSCGLRSPTSWPGQQSDREPTRT